MRVLGIDYGSKRIGLALSDPEGRLAFPYATAKGLGQVVAAAKKERVGKIIVGLPLTFRGRKSEQSRETERFVAELQKALQLPVEVENEIFTTKIAGRHTAKSKADAAAAALILQSYLDRGAGILP